MSIIIFGDEVAFESAQTNNITTAMLDSTHVVVAYKDVDNSSYGTACVGSIYGTTITWGTPVVFNAGNATWRNSVAALDSTHFVVVYEDGANSSHGTAIVGVTDGGTTISSFGSESVFNAAGTYYPAVSALDSTHFVVAYKDDGNSYVGTARVGVVSGTTISSYGAENVFNSVETRSIAISALDSTHFVVAYRDVPDTNHGTAIVGVTNGGTTISSYGTGVEFNSVITDAIAVDALDPTHFVVAYRDYGGDYYGCTRVGLVSGTTISSYGAESIVNSANTTDNSVAALDSTHFVVSYRDEGGSDYGCARVGLISGTTVESYGAEVTFNSQTTWWTSIAPLSPTHFVIIYEDGGTTYGTGIVGKIAIGPSPTFFQP